MIEYNGLNIPNLNALKREIEKLTSNYHSLSNSKQLLEFKGISEFKNDDEFQDDENEHQIIDENVSSNYEMKEKNNM